MKSLEVSQIFDRIGLRLTNAERFERLRVEMSDFWDTHGFRFKAWQEVNAARIDARDLDGIVFW